jgi:hypothetical protein
MREIGMMCLIGLLSGCCAIKESTTTTIRDSVIVFQPEPINIDSLYAQYPYLFNAQCDTLAILAKYGAVEFEREDSSGYYRILWSSAERRLQFLERRKPTERVVAIDHNITNTVIQKLPFMTLLGYVGSGMLLMMGFVVALKGFKVI